MVIIGWRGIRKRRAEVPTAKSELRGEDSMSMSWGSEIMTENQTEGDLHRLGEQLDSLTIGGAGRRDEHGYIAAVIGDEGYIFYGPYLALPIGHYSVRMMFAADRNLARASSDPGLVLEAANRFETIASFPLDDTSLDLGMVALPFTLPGGSGSEQSNLEIRLFSRGKCPVVVTSIDLRRMTSAFVPHFAHVKRPDLRT